MENNKNKNNNNNNNNNNNKNNVVGHGSGSSLDHLFGPRDSPSASASSISSSAGLFNSIFPPPSTVLGRERKRDLGNQFGSGKYEKSDYNNMMMGQSRKGESSSGVTSKDSSNIYQNHESEPCYFSSSIYYGGQENYSPRTSRTTESQHLFKNDGSEDDPNGNNSNSASRGNWWQGSLYY